MNQEQVIELAKESGFPTWVCLKHPLGKETALEIVRPPESQLKITKMMEKFAALVEQATLERAAKVCTSEVARMTNDLHGTTFYIATGQCAQAIRNLAKEPQ